MKDNLQAEFQEAHYKDTPIEDIKADLRKQGYDPFLIKEKPNDSLAAHKHPESHILVQVAGQMTVSTGGKHITMKPGDKLFMPPHVEHAAEFGPEGSQYLWMEF